MRFLTDPEVKSAEKSEFWSNVKKIHVTKNQHGSSGKVRDYTRKIQKNRRHKMDKNRSSEKIFVSNKYDGTLRVTKKSSSFWILTFRWCDLGWQNFLLVFFPRNVQQLQKAALLKFFWTFSPLILPNPFGNRNFQLFPLLF